MFFKENNLIVNIFDAEYLQWNKATRHSSSRPFHSLSMREIGNCVYRIDGIDHHISSGDILFMPKNIDFTLTREYERFFTIQFDIFSEKDFKFFAFRPKDEEIYKNLFKNLYYIWFNRKPGYQFAATAILYKIFEYLLVDMSAENSFIKKEEDKMQPVLEYIHSNFRNSSITIPNLAEIYGTSETTFRQDFKNSVNVTPLKYINNLRVKFAEELLQTGLYTIAEVAEAVGFIDPKYFSRVIKNQKGISPKNLKSNILKSLE